MLYLINIYRRTVYLTIRLFFSQNRANTAGYDNLSATYAIDNDITHLRSFNQAGIKGIFLIRHINILK